MLKILYSSELDQIASFIDEIHMQQISCGQINKIECYEGVNLISFDWYNILDKESDPEQITIYNTSEHLFFICENDSCYNLVNQLVKEDASNEKTLYIFFTELIKNDIAYIDELEERITDTEDDLITSSNKECAHEIIDFRRELLKLKRYYEQLNHIFKSLSKMKMG